MNYYLLILIVVLANCEVVAQPKNVVERITTHLDANSVMDSILLYDPPFEGDPGEFTKIGIYISGIGRFNFSAKDVWDKVDDSFLEGNINAVNSRRVFIHKNKTQTLIFLFGFSYGSGRDEFSVIQIRDKKVSMLFDDEFQTPIKLLDSASISLVGKRHNGEYFQYVDSLNADIESYQPYYVYKISDDFRIDEQATKKYNELHYVWKGIKYDSSIRVLCPRNESKCKVLN